jgi:dTDP-4-amino-4,6-dideoxygalactose transaminase
MSHQAPAFALPAIRGGEPMFAERFRFIKPTLPPREAVLAAYAGAYANGLITNASLVGRFEEAAAERLGVAHCVAVHSCTAGLMLVLKSLGVAGEVILPSFTFFATGHAAVWNGLRPVFADCDPHTWTIDPADVESKINENTGAILAVHMYGNPCAVERLERVAARHNLRLIFDAAHAFGSRRRGRSVGQFGDAEVFSLSPTKLLVAGEGGLVATNDGVLARRLRAARNYGDTGSYDPEVLGINSRMTEFNAALGLAGLEILDSKIARHTRIASTYTGMLFDLPGLVFQKVEPDDVCVYKDYSIVMDGSVAGIRRDELAAGLLAENIETKKYFYPPMHRQKLYQQFHRASDELAATNMVSEGVLSLPIYESLANETVEGVATAVRRLIAWAQETRR